MNKLTHESIDYDGYEYDDYNDNIIMRDRASREEYLKKYNTPSDIEGINNIYTLLLSPKNIYTIASSGQARLLYRKGWKIIAGFNNYNDAYDAYENSEHILYTDFMNPIDALYESKKQKLYESIIKKIAKEVKNTINAYN